MNEEPRDGWIPAKDREDIDRKDGQKMAPLAKRITKIIRPWNLKIEPKETKDKRQRNDLEEENEKSMEN